VQVELLQRGGQPLPVGDRQHRVAGDREQRAQLTLARGGDLRGHHGRGEGAEDVREVTDPGPGLAVRRLAGALGQALHGDDLAGEQHAARPVQVAGDDAERVQQEADQGGVPAQAGAGPAVRRGARCGREVPGQRAHGPGRHAGDPLGLFRWVRGRGPADQVVSGGLLGDGRRVLESLREDHVQQRQQQPRVGVGAHGDMLEGPGRLGAAGVDDNDAAPTVRDRRQLVLHPRRVHGAAVGHQRVGAEHQQEVGAREVGERQLGQRAVEQPARDEAAVDVL
jgi:hypothetical protein